MTDHTALIAKLKAATGPDRVLADEILFATRWVGHLGPDPTADIQAALNLLPDRSAAWTLGRDVSGKYFASISMPSTMCTGAATPAIAVAAVALSARSRPDVDLAALIKKSVQEFNTLPPASSADCARLRRGPGS